MKRHGQPFEQPSEEARLDGEPGTRAHLLIVDGKEASPREYARVMAAQPYPWSEDEIEADLARYHRPPFRLL